MLEKVTSASAGTGKTYSILNDVFAYDDDGVPRRSYAEALKIIESTVFLSFSNAAVEELRARIWSDLKKTTGRAAASTTTVSIRATTLHRFCLDVARTFRYEIGLPADVAFVTATDDDDVWSDTVAACFDLEWNLQRVGDDLQQHFGFTVDEAHRAATYLLTVTRSADLQAFARNDGQKIFFLGQLGHAIETPDGAPGVALRDFVRRADFDARAAEHAAVISVLDETSTSDKVGALIKANAASFFELEQALSSVSGLLQHLLARIGRDHYLPAMLRTGVFDFDALIFLVLGFLQEQAGGANDFLALLRDEDLAIDRLYFDEAQDTDVLQNLFVSAFAGDNGCPVKVSIVGDLKQSLYSWRSAVPEQFRLLHDEARLIPDAASPTGKRAHGLTHSYRVNNGQTLRLLNDMSKAVVQQPYSRGRSWDYVDARDDLQAPPGKTLSTSSPTTAYWKGDGTHRKLSPEAIEQLDAFLGQGRCGVLVRGRTDLATTGLRQYLATKNVRYRLADKVAFDAAAANDAALWASSPWPDLTLLQAVGSLFDGSDASVAQQLLLLFSPIAAPALAALVPSPPPPAADGRVSPRDVLLQARRAAAVVADAGKGTGLLRLFDRHDLWKLLGTHDPNAPWSRSRRRAMALAAMLSTEEERARNEADVEMPRVDFEGMLLPYEWFPAPGHEHARGDSIEVTTVHSSKGFEYDRVVAVGDFGSNFFASKLNHNAMADGPVAQSLVSFSFEHLLSTQPAVKIRCFPWLGDEALKLAREISPAATSSLIGTQYTAVEHRLLTEKRNLFYVAVTRTRADLLLIDHGEDDTPIAPLFAASSVAPFAPRASSTTLFSAVAVREGLHETPRLPYALPFVSVRDLAGNNEPHGPIDVAASSSPLARSPDVDRGFRRMKVGAALHQLLEHLSWVREHPDAVARAIAWSRSRGWTGEEAVAVFEAAHNEDVVARVVAAFAAARDILPEVRIWGVDEGPDDEGNVRRRLVRGVLDALAVGGDGPGLSVVEYKVAFGSSDTKQQAAGERQAAVYGRLLSPAVPAGGVVDPLIAVFLLEAPRGPGRS
jgi:superfamily I DNA/RNA helicase